MTAFPTRRQARAARQLLGWTAEKLASVADVSASTIRDFERGAREPQERNMRKIMAAFTEAGIRFTPGKIILNEVEKPMPVYYPARFGKAP